MKGGKDKPGALDRKGAVPSFGDMVLREGMKEPRREREFAQQGALARVTCLHLTESAHTEMMRIWGKLLENHTKYGPLQLGAKEAWNQNETSSGAVCKHNQKLLEQLEQKKSNKSP